MIKAIFILVHIRLAFVWPESGGFSQVSPGNAIRRLAVAHSALASIIATPAAGRTPEPGPHFSVFRQGGHLYPPLVPKQAVAACPLPDPAIEKDVFQGGITALRGAAASGIVHHDLLHLPGCRDIQLQNEVGILPGHTKHPAVNDWGAPVGFVKPDSKEIRVAIGAEIEVLSRIIAPRHRVRAFPGVQSEELHLIAGLCPSTRNGEGSCGSGGRLGSLACRSIQCPGHQDHTGQHGNFPHIFHLTHQTA